MRKLLKKVSLSVIVAMALVLPPLSVVAKEGKPSIVCNIVPFVCSIDMGAGGTGHAETQSGAGGTGHGGSGSGSGGATKPDKD